MLCNYSSPVAPGEERVRERFIPQKQKKKKAPHILSSLHHHHHHPPPILPPLYRSVVLHCRRQEGNHSIISKASQNRSISSSTGEKTKAGNKCYTHGAHRRSMYNAGTFAHRQLRNVKTPKQTHTEVFHCEGLHSWTVMLLAQRLIAIFYKNICTTLHNHPI